MIDLATTIATTRVGPGELALFWLGQAGFLLKDTDGGQFVIDPYLTDCGQRMKGFCGFKRITPKLLAPHELKPDLYLITHHHFDHYDYDAVPIVATESAAHFCGPPSCMRMLNESGVPETRTTPLQPGEGITYGGIRITATEADHGDLAPDAIGAVVEMGGHRVYFSGDTGYHREYVDSLRGHRPDVAVLSVNGAFGNMDAREGARFALELGVAAAIPCHFWTFTEHGGDPHAFVRELSTSATCKPVLLHQGEMLLLHNNEEE